MQVVQLAFDVARVVLPFDSIRDSRKIWNHVDELALSPALAALLARNGVRIGVGSPDTSAPIRAVLETAKPEVSEERLFAQGGAPISVRLSTVEDGEPIFFYGADGRLTGRTFEGGDKLLNLDYQVHANAGGGVDVRIGFEVRRDLGVMTWERVDGVVREVPAYNSHVFEELRPTLALKPGEFLVIGLGEMPGNSYVLGNRMLGFERSGEKFETVLFITPRAAQVLAVPTQP